MSKVHMDPCAHFDKSQTSLEGTIDGVEKKV